MKQYTDTDRKGNVHCYNIYQADEMTVELFDTITHRHYVTDRSRKGHNKGQDKEANGWEKSQVIKNSYINIPMAFDIETTSTETGAYMYIWQLGILDNVVIGRTWKQFIDLMQTLSDHLKCSYGQRVIVWVHNLSFEWQFIKYLFDFSDTKRCFFKEERKPLFVQPADLCFQFKDSLAMTNSSLARLAKDYCSIDKKKGDLDYTIERNDETELTDEELSYCYNDVLILTEFATWFWNTYITAHSCPLTCTGALYNEVKLYVKNMEYQGTMNDKLKQYLKECWNDSYEDYEEMMSCLYRGGYTHAGELSVGYEMDSDDNICSFDFTSSYPAVMLLKKFPYKFEEIQPTEGNLQSSIDSGLCCIIKATFYNIERQPWSDSSIESTSKCIELENAQIDNGRVRSADKMTVELTELDYATYTEFYHWERIEITKLLVSQPVKLPVYLVKPMVHYAVAKNRLKHNGQPYALEKARLNSFYGLCVKRINTEKTVFNGDGFEQLDILNWDKETEKPLLPQWGVWISAHARRNLLATVHKIEKLYNKRYFEHRVAYCDTDSMKIVNFDADCQQVIDDYNKQIEAELQTAFNYYDIPEEDNQWIKDLGMFDAEGKLLRFKTLGAKRYLYTHLNKKGEEELVQTVAGLPKNSMIEHFGDIDSCFEKFEDEMSITESGKLMPKYFDEPTITVVAGKEMYSRSSVSLLPCDFNLAINGTWLEQVQLLANWRFVYEEQYE